MRAVDLFPDDAERSEVRRIVELFNGRITRVTDADGVLLFP